MHPLYKQIQQNLVLISLALSVWNYHVETCSTLHGNTEHTGFYKRGEKCILKEFQNVFHKMNFLFFFFPEEYFYKLINELLQMFSPSHIWSETWKEFSAGAS